MPARLIWVMLAAALAGGAWLGARLLAPGERQGHPAPGFMQQEDRAAEAVSTRFEIPQGAVPARVLDVIDGDTIEVELGTRRVLVRYIGINAPELRHEQKGTEYFGREAAAANARLVKGRQVRIAFDVQRRDRFGRLLGYVFVPPSTFVNAWLVEHGYALAYTFPPNVRYAELFRRLQARAREAGRGLWAHEEPVPTISPAEASRHIGAYRRIVGRITWAREEEGFVLLRLAPDGEANRRDAGQGQAPRTVQLVIERSNWASFPEHPLSYVGKRVQVEGRINRYGRQPEVQVVFPDQLVVLEEPVSR